MAKTSETGVWIQAGSWQLSRYEKHVLRHPHGKPSGQKRTQLLLDAVRSIYPDAERQSYAGGVLQFRWNGGEGSGEAYNAATTPGPISYRVSKSSEAASA